MRRVVVTGLGAVSPLGLDVESTWEGMVKGRSGIARITRFDPEPFRVRIAGEVKGFDPLDHMDKKQARRTDRNVQFALAAAQQAASDAGLSASTGNSEAFGVIFGSAIGGVGLLTDQLNTMAERGPDRVSPFFLPNMLVDSASGHIAIALGFRGPNFAVVSACATGGGAIGEAVEAVRRGDAEAIIAGGTEAPILPIVFAGFQVMKALGGEEGPPEKASRPFDAKRNGFVVAEGAAAVVVESLEHALRRGARIYAEAVGYGVSNDAYHMAAPAEGGTGIEQAMRMALRKAALRPDEVDYVNAHGTSTPANDRVETAALKRVFGEHAYRLAVSSTKSVTGHMMGAAGAMETVASILALRDQLLPPTINYEHPDPDCDLDYVPNQARSARVDVVLTNTIGLGGHNATLIFRKFE